MGAKDSLLRPQMNLHLLEHLVLVQEKVIYKLQQMSHSAKLRFESLLQLFCDSIFGHESGRARGLKLSYLKPWKWTVSKNQSGWSLYMKVNGLKKWIRRFLRTQTKRSLDKKITGLSAKTERSLVSTRYLFNYRPVCVTLTMIWVTPGDYGCACHYFILL